MLDRIRKIVLVGHDNDGSAQLFDRITSDFPDVEFLLVVGEGLYYRKSFIASVIKLLREASFVFVVHRFIALVKYSVRGESMVSKARRKRIPFFGTRDINSAETMERIRRFEPDLLVSLFTMQIYRQPVIDLPKFGSISSHPSILPHYRGLEVFFWVLANEEKETGVSVFFLAEKIDAGKVFEQQVVPITPEMTVSSLYQTITEIGGDLLVAGIRDIDRDNVQWIPSDGSDGSYYRMPDRHSMRRFRKTGRRLG